MLPRGPEARAGGVGVLGTCRGNGLQLAAAKGVRLCDAVAKPRWWNDEGLKTLSASVVGAAPNSEGAHRMLAIVLSGLCGGVWEVGPRSAAELKDTATHFERSMALCAAPSGEFTRCADWCRSQAEAVP